MRFKPLNCVARKAGWDTHGLPVELQVQKELGISDKRDILKLKSTERESIAYFNEKCLETVMRYKDEWEKSTDRLAFWLDLKNAYMTCSNEYIESLWHVISQAWEKNLLVQDYKIVPFCPSCVTPLSSHEVAQGYAKVKEESVYVLCALKGEPNTFLLVWTTTPWTLVGNVALAVGEEIEYVKVQKDEVFILAKSVYIVFQRQKLLLKCWARICLVWSMNPCMIFHPNREKGWYIVGGDFVNTQDGSGIVHMAWYGDDDYEMIKSMISRGHSISIPRKGYCGCWALEGSVV